MLGHGVGVVVVRAIGERIKERERLERTEFRSCVKVEVAVLGSRP